MAKDDWKHTASARGKAAELRFGQLALERGWDLAMPLVEDLPYDVLVNRHALTEHGQEWERVQVKRSYLKDGYPTVNLVRHDGKRYNEADAHWLAAIEVETGRCWFIPFGDVCRYQRKRITADLEQHELSRTQKEEDDVY